MGRLLENRFKDEPRGCVAREVASTSCYCVSTHPNQVTTTFLPNWAQNRECTSGAESRLAATAAAGIPGFEMHRHHVHRFNRAGKCLCALPGAHHRAAPVWLAPIWIKSAFSNSTMGSGSTRLRWPRPTN